MKPRQYYKQTNDIDGTLRQLPRYLVAERAIVSIKHVFPLKFFPVGFLLISSASIKFSVMKWIILFLLCLLYLIQFLFCWLV